MQTQEWTRLWHHRQLDVGLLQAFYVQHAYPRHSHDYYVICLIERGFQSFLHEREKHFTPPGGLIFINPGVVHTGEAADANGFEMYSLYPTTMHMETAVYELTGRYGALPFFRNVRVDHRWARKAVLSLHKTLANNADAMKTESRFIWTLTQLIKRYADVLPNEKHPGNERNAIQKARQYIEDHFAEGINLTQLADLVSLSPYYFLRAFRAEVGMPPYVYLESVRIRQAQRLIESFTPLAEVALETGFSSQSHLTNRFKKIIGVTPGQYAQQLKK